VRALVWELIVGALGLLLGVLFLIGSGYVMGCVFLVASAAWLAYRIRFVDAGSRPGGFAFGGALLDSIRAFIVWTSLALVWVLLVVSWMHHWNRDSRGQVATFALAGLGFFLARELKRVSDRASLRYDGGLAEERVVESLAPLQARGWVIENNVLRGDGYGDIDLIARAPSTTVYAIETKSSGWGYKAVGQAVGGAIWLKKRLGARFVTAVVCVPGDIPARKYGAGWIVGADRIAEWLGTDPAR
jgi:hypothetical protein